MEVKIMELHLPWDNDTIKNILQKIIKIGETSKVDFKQDLNIETQRDKAELLKDISAIANTYDPNYDNYGFILIGVRQNEIIGSSFLEKFTVDNLQSIVDDLVKKYLSPFIKTQVMIFDDNGKKWGVIIIPPSRMLPHVFIKDIDNKRRGDIYVRKGTTTEKASPEDYYRFFSVYIEDIRYEFHHQIDNIRSELEDIKRNLYALTQTNQVPGDKANILQKDKEEKNIIKNIIPTREKNLLEEIDNFLGYEEDRIKNGLIKEAKKILSFLESDAIPWVLQIPSKEEGSKILSEIEKKSEIFWMALSKIILKDDKNKYDEAIIQSLGYLARYYEAPAGMPYNDLGQYIRYYSLVVSLYIIFIVGAFKKRYILLKKIASMELLGRSLYSFYEKHYPIAYSLFFIRGAGEVFQTQHEKYPNSKWCDPVASYIKTLLDKKLNIDDYRWNKDANFYIGEFLLSLITLDVVDKNTGALNIGHPSPGLFMYAYNAIPVIRRFLKQERDWIAKIFHRSLEDILKDFDKTAWKAVNPLCSFSANGFLFGAFESAFPEKAKKDKEQKK